MSENRNAWLVYPTAWRRGYAYCSKVCAFASRAFRRGMFVSGDIQHMHANCKCDGCGGHIQ